MKKSLLRVATLESDIITTTPATRAFFDANPTFHVNVVKDANGDLRAVFTSATTGERHLTMTDENGMLSTAASWNGSARSPTASASSTSRRRARSI